MNHLGPVGGPSRRLKILLLALAAGLVAAPASAGDFEVAVQVGRALPFYSQSFAFDPGDLLPPDYPVQTSGGFDLELSGGLTVSGALTWRFSESLGLEARVDTAKVDLQVKGGQVSTDLGDLIPGLPSIPISGDISGEAPIGRLVPVSLNLQFVAGESVQFVASGGLSYIPPVTVAATVDIGLAIDAIPGLPPITLPDLGVSAAATLDGGFGGNLGAGLRVPVGSHVALLFDARAFGFPKRELQWGTGSGHASPIEQALAAALDPIEFEYGFFQATGGLVFTF
jgi:hypothetical protein